MELFIETFMMLPQVAGCVFGRRTPAGIGDSNSSTWMPLLVAAGNGGRMGNTEHTGTAFQVSGGFLLHYTLGGSSEATSERWTDNRAQVGPAADEYAGRQVLASAM